MNFWLANILFVFMILNYILHFFGKFIGSSLVFFMTGVISIVIWHGFLKKQDNHWPVFVLIFSITNVLEIFFTKRFAFDWPNVSGLGVPVSILLIVFFILFFFSMSVYRKVEKDLEGGAGIIDVSAYLNETVSQVYKNKVETWKHVFKKVKQGKIKELIIAQLDKWIAFCEKKSGVIKYSDSNSLDFQLGENVKDKIKNK